MKIRFVIFFLFVFSGLKAQTVTVTNVEQDGQTLVVSYDITGGTGKYEVSLHCSTDDGTTWAGPLKSVSGDVGKNIAAGQGKKITWTVLSDRADLKSDNVRFKVKAWKVEGTVTDVDGNTYETVKIGGQVWMKENLRVSHYQNGDPIPTNLSNSQWEKTTSGAFAIYKNDEANQIKYGNLYNWYAVVDKRNLCPVGWHVPLDEEWSILENFLGGVAFAGGKMKSKKVWQSPNREAVNGSGFSGLPGGNRASNGTYGGIGYLGFWWVFSEISSANASYRFLNYDDGYCDRNGSNVQVGFSVRCLRD
jgi:uncharacterized protein (TIGR02145 family)